MARVSPIVSEMPNASRSVQIAGKFSAISQETQVPAAMRTTVAPSPLFLPAFDLAGRRLHLLQLLEEEAAVAGQHIAGLAADEERAPHALLQLQHAAADRGRTKTRRLRRPGQAAATRYRDEAAVNIPIRVFHS